MGGADTSGCNCLWAASCYQLRSSKIATNQTKKTCPVRFGWTIQIFLACLWDISRVSLKRIQVWRTRVGEEFSGTLVRSSRTRRKAVNYLDLTPHPAPQYPALSLFHGISWIFSQIPAGPQARQSTRPRGRPGPGWDIWCWSGRGGALRPSSPRLELNYLRHFSVRLRGRARLSTLYSQAGDLRVLEMNLETFPRVLQLTMAGATVNWQQYNGPRPGSTSDKNIPMN